MLRVARRRLRGGRRWGVLQGGGWWGRGQLRARVCNAAAAAVEVHSAVEFAAAMQTMVSGWTKYTNRITVDPQAACVSYQQNDYNCIIFSVGGGPRVQFVNIEGLPPSFIDVRRAQEVRVNAREMNPHLTATLEPPPASSATHACTTQRVRHRAPLLSSCCPHHWNSWSV